MLRALVALLLVIAAVLVGLWQFGILGTPFGGAPQAIEERNTLFEVVRSGDVAAVQERLAAGEAVDATDAFGQTPLMDAIHNRVSLAVVDALVEAGADVNAVSDTGWTPLMYAARDGADPRPALYLLNAGADPTVTNAEGQTALDLARENSTVRNSGLFGRLEELTERPFVRGWPSAYVVPVAGATLSSRANHLPGAPRAYRNGTHEGFDFYDGTVSVPIEYGTPVQAVANGTVLRADTDYVELTREGYDALIADASGSLSTPPEVLDALRGRQVWIEHAGGFVSRYAHLSGVAPEIVVGSTVSQGQEIGYTGNSGTAEAAEGLQDDPHPHVEIWQGDRTFLGSGLEPRAIYDLAAQVFGERALPPFTDVD